MRDRFTYKLTGKNSFDCTRTLDQPARKTQPRYNFSSTDPVDSIVERDGKRELVSCGRPRDRHRNFRYNALMETAMGTPSTDKVERRHGKHN